MARTEFIRVRVTPEEKKIIREKALSSYRLPSDYARDCMLGKEIIVMDGLRELHTELRRQGNNLNQLTVLARQNKIQRIDFKPFMEVMNKVWQALSSLQSRVAG